MSDSSTVGVDVRRQNNLSVVGRILRWHLLGPVAALAVAVIIFSLISPRFFTPVNLSLILQQSVVIGILAVGQTLIILTSGIDLSIGSMAVMGTIVLALTASTHGPVAGLLMAVLACLIAGALNGAIVTLLGLPPFIVTLGTYTIIFAFTQLLAGSQTFPISDPFLTVLGQTFSIGGFTTTWGVVAMLVVYIVIGYALTQTAWGKHVMAVGGNPLAAELSGIRSNRNLFTVYLAAALIAAIATWAAIGRIPNADPNAYQNANLQSITATVIGGTSLFGGRGGVLGTLVGMLIVSVLRNGLTLAGVDSLYQDIATGILVIAAVAVDQITRSRTSK